VHGDFIGVFLAYFGLYISEYQPAAVGVDSDPDILTGGSIPRVLASVLDISTYVLDLAGSIILTFGNDDFALVTAICSSVKPLTFSLPFNPSKNWLRKSS